MLGIDILEVIKDDESITSKVIMISAVGQESIIKESMDIGAEDYIVKPFTPEKLSESVSNIFK